MPVSNVTASPVIGPPARRTWGDLLAARPADCCRLFATGGLP